MRGKNTYNALSYYYSVMCAKHALIRSFSYLHMKYVSHIESFKSLTSYVLMSATVAAVAAFAASIIKFKAATPNPSRIRQITLTQNRKFK